MPGGTERHCAAYKITDVPATELTPPARSKTFYGTNRRHAGAQPVKHRSTPIRIFLSSAAILAGAAVVTLAALPGAEVRAQKITFFRVGTGSTGGTYFPIGGLIANAISNPPGSRPCDRGGSCGVPGLIAVAQSTQGSVDNVARIKAGSLESGLVQADIAYWAFNGAGIYKPKDAVKSLRAIASLYPESIHIVVRRNSKITSVRALRGKRVSMGEKSSGTLVDAKIILRAYGVRLREIKPHYLAAGAAADALREGKIDAFFLVAGSPVPAIVALAETVDIAMVPINGPKAASIKKKYPFFSSNVVPMGEYKGVPDTDTLTVGAQWLVDAKVDANVVYRITKALWHKSTGRLLARGHPEGKRITLETALKGVGIPLHPGAERYYREAGVLKAKPEQDEPGRKNEDEKDKDKTD